MEKETDISTAIKKLEEEIASVKFGFVSAYIQDGVIVQIEKNEKFRLK